MKKNKPIHTWRIYYSNGTTFDNTQGSPADAPPTGVICIKQNNRMHGNVVTAFKDFYWWNHDEWWGSDQAGFWQYMFVPGNKVVKFGVSVPSEVFHEIMKVAIADKDFPPKSAKSALDYDYETTWSSEGFEKEVS
jgi:hypothetical protein